MNIFTMNIFPPMLPLLTNSTLHASAVILLLLAARPWLRRFFGSALVSMLWIVVLFRLLMLWPVHSAWSVFNLWPEARAHAIPAEAWKVNVTVSGSPLEKTQSAQKIHAVGPGAQSQRWSGLLVMVWALGATGMLAHFALRMMRGRFFARQKEPAADARVMEIFQSIPETLRSRTSVHVTGEVSVPSLTGIRRPQIWLPRGWLDALSESEIRHVLLHELGHAHRGDLVVQWFFALAQCVHWFNPLVWLAARQARADAEMACDAWVLARVTETEHECYGATLLKATQLFRMPRPFSPAAIGMAANRRTLVTRIRHVGEYRPVSRWRTLSGLAGGMIAAVILMTDQLSAQAPAASSVSPAAAPVADSKPAAKTTGSPTPSRAQKPVEQIEIESKFFEIPASVAKELGFIPSKKDKSDLSAIQEGRGVAETLGKLNQAKGVDLLSAPRVTTRSGQRATIEIIREFRYPTEFETDKASGKMTPKAFEIRNLGITLDVEPVIGRDRTIDLNLVPQVVALEGFINAKTGQPLPLPGGKSVEANLTLNEMASVQIPKDVVIQPVFSSRKVTTNVSLKSGQSIILGGLRKDAQEQKGLMLYFIITARIIDAAQPEEPATSASP